ncbi:MAG: hypothetical protein LAO55_24775 [Acidobacteriia bacterium]|nr:hypothetical protein [Terriglobia bacterium]
MAVLTADLLNDTVQALVAPLLRSLGAQATLSNAAGATRLNVADRKSPPTLAVTVAA